MSFEQIVKWENGVPVVDKRKVLSKETLEDITLTSISKPYKRTEKEIEKGEGEEFEGLTYGEVIAIRLARQAASGDKEAAKMLYDRVLGKPKMQAEVKTLSMTYRDFIEELARNEKNPESGS